MKPLTKKLQMFREKHKLLADRNEKGERQGERQGDKVREGEERKYISILIPDNLPTSYYRHHWGPNLHLHRMPLYPSNQLPSLSNYDFKTTLEMQK